MCSRTLYREYLRSSFPRLIVATISGKLVHARGAGFVVAVDAIAVVREPALLELRRAGRRGLAGRDCESALGEVSKKKGKLAAQVAFWPLCWQCRYLPPKRGRAGFFKNIMGQCRYRRWKKGSVGNKTSLLGQCRYCAVAVQVFRWQRGHRAIANGAQQVSAAPSHGGRGGAR